MKLHTHTHTLVRRNIFNELNLCRPPRAVYNPHLKRYIKFVRCLRHPSNEENANETKLFLAPPSTVHSSSGGPALETWPCVTSCSWPEDCGNIFYTLTVFLSPCVSFIIFLSLSPNLSRFRVYMCGGIYLFWFSIYTRKWVKSFAILSARISRTRSLRRTPRSLFWTSSGAWLCKRNNRRLEAFRLLVSTRLPPGGRAAVLSPL